MCNSLTRRCCASPASPAPKRGRGEICRADARGRGKGECAGGSAGRDARRTLLPLLGRPLIGLFTQDGNSPAEVARFFHERGAGDYEARVAENIGSDRERVHRWVDLDALLQQTSFAPLNYLILRRTLPAATLAQRQRHRAQVPGVPDDVFSRPDDGPEVMALSDVRAVTLGKLGGDFSAGATAWDIGAGLGTVAVELAV